MGSVVSEDFLASVIEAFSFIAGVDRDDLEFEFRDGKFIVFGTEDMLKMLSNEFRNDKGATITKTYKTGNRSGSEFGRENMFPAFCLETHYKSGDTMPDIILNLHAMSLPIRLDGFVYPRSDYIGQGYAVRVGDNGAELLWFRDDKGEAITTFGDFRDIVTIRPKEGEKGVYEYEDYSGITHSIEAIYT